MSSFYQAALKGSKTDLPHASVDLTGTTVIVTGSNTGLGKELAAKLLAMRPEKFIIAVRSLSKGETARSDLLKAIPELDPSTIEVWPIDMADFSSVKAFAERADSQLSRLDIAVLNAGVWPAKFEVTKDGWETALQVNCLSTFYLSLLLLPLMQRTASSFYPSTRPGTLSKPHMTLVTSGLHFLASLSAKSKPEILAAMNVPKGWGADARYNDTKLMVVFWVKALAERVQRASASTMGGGGSVIVNGVNPGFCAGSGLADHVKESSFGARVGVPAIAKLFGRTIEMGARGMAWAVINGSVQGAYSVNCVDEPGSPFVNSTKGRETQDRMWKEVIGVLNRVDPSIARGIAST